MERRNRRDREREQKKFKSLILCEVYVVKDRIVETKANNGQILIRHPPKPVLLNLQYCWRKAHKLISGNFGAATKMKVSRGARVRGHLPG